MKVELKHLGDEQLANGLVVKLYDQSRRVAGDRWQVKVRFDAVVKVSETFWNLVSGEPELIEEVRAALGSEIVFSNVIERNFISEEDKEGLVAKIVTRNRKNLLKYLADPGFPERLFQRRYKEVREAVEQKNREVYVLDNEDIEDPADFSYLFKT